MKILWFGLHVVILTISQNQQSYPLQTYLCSLAQNHYLLICMLAASYAPEHLCGSLTYCSLHERK